MDSNEPQLAEEFKAAVATHDSFAPFESIDSSGQRYMAHSRFLHYPLEPKGLWIVECNGWRYRMYSPYRVRNKDGTVGRGVRDVLFCKVEQC